MFWHPVSHSPLRPLLALMPERQSLGTYMPRLTESLGDTVPQTSASIGRPMPGDVLQQRLAERTASGNTRSRSARPQNHE